MLTEKYRQILPGIYCVPVPLTGTPLKELNTYLIRGTDGPNLLVDTGFQKPECRQAILDACRELGIAMENTDILLTHMHGDHLGNVCLLHTEGRKVMISRTDCEMIRSLQETDGKKNAHVRKYVRFREHGVPADVLDAMYRGGPAENLERREYHGAYTMLEDGALLSYGGYNIRAILTPGHTPGHMCYEIEQTGSMILGDHVLFDISPNITDWPGVEDSLGNYLASLDKIDRYDVRIPLPAHRQPGDFHGRIRQLKQHHAQRLDECMAIIDSVGTAGLYDIAAAMKWRIRADGWNSFPPRQKWFALGECLAHLDHLVCLGKIVRCKEDGIVAFRIAEQAKPGKNMPRPE